MRCCCSREARHSSEKHAEGNGEGDEYVYVQDNLHRGCADVVSNNLKYPADIFGSR